LRLLDLFSGIGGFSLAFKNVFTEGEIIGYSEIDKYAIKVYENHFEGVKNFGDIGLIERSELPDFDICTFGFPCQDISVAGKGKGLDGKRSGLFYKAIEIINEKRPPYFIFENVKGLLTRRQDFIKVLQAITDIGYSGQWEIINTAWYLPQNRERIYFVGYPTGECRPEIFPIGEDSFSYSKCNKSEENLVTGVASRGRESGQCLEIRKDDVVNTLISVWKDSYLQFDVSGKGYKSQQDRVYFNTMGTIPSCRTENKINIYDGKVYRRLTPIEAERLQGFPDDWTNHIPESQRYKCIGNAISIPPAEEIFKKLKLFMERNSYKNKDIDNK
jgi:DNA (cytosine-5)-methyltransferase 1